MLISIVILIVIICVLSIKLMQINAKSLSRDSFKKEAIKQAKKIEFKDPIITCDYCGTKIDTAKEKSCPSCGATFAKDLEWVNRQNLDEKSLEALADKYAQKKLDEVKKKSAVLSKKLKICIGILGGILGVLIILVIILGAITSKHDYIKPNELNKYSFENFSLTDYNVKGNNVLIDDSGIKVSINGFYYDVDDNETKIEYLIENNSDTDLCVSFECVGINGYTKEGSYDFFYEWIKKNSSVNTYETLYGFEDKEVKNIIYYNLSVRNEEDCIYENKDFVSFETNSDYAPEMIIPSGITLFENETIKVIKTGKVDDRYNVCIVNNSNNNYIVESTDLKLNGNEIESFGLYGQALPAKHILTTSLRSYDDKAKNIKTSDKLEVSFSLQNKKDPSTDLSTGYLNIN